MDHLGAARTFVRVVELGSFTAAAADLRVGQATVSRRVAQLEEALGVRLLDRTTRALRVTDAGRRFCDDARGAVDAWDAAVDGARAADADVSGRVRVSVPVVFGQRLVMPALPSLVAAHPRLRLEVGYDDRYVDLVRDGVDIAVRVGRPVDSGYRARVLGNTPRWLVAAPEYVARHGAPAEPAELRRHACLLHSGLHTPTVWRFTLDEREVPVQVAGRFAANHSETLLRMAEAGQGVALLADWLVRDAIDRGRLVVLLPAFSPPPAPIHALYGAGRYTPRAVRVVLDALESAVAAGLPASPTARSAARGRAQGYAAGRRRS